jgi:pimeloyl-ACP methyl ester carboxylesterase
MYSLAQGEVETLRTKLSSGFPPADRNLIELPENMAMMVEEIKEGYRQGWSGPACDDIVINAPWAFYLRDIPTRVDIWHGELDENIPINHARYNHEQIPDSRLTVWPELAHLGVLCKWREVLGALTGK